MNFQTFLAFLVPALKVVQKQLDKTSPAYNLVTMVLSLASAFNHPAAFRPGMASATHTVEMGSVTASLPPQPWTPESLEKFAANLPSANPVA